MGDMHSQGAVYHKDCLSALHNKARKYKTEHSKTEKHTYSESIALSELVTYIEETRLDGGADLYFKLADLVKLYHNTLEQLGVSIPKRINTTRLKERLLDQMPNLKAHTKGRDVVLAFDDDIADALIIASQFKKDGEIMHLAKTAQIVRKEMLQKKQAFDGSFPPEALTESVPDSLLALINMIVEGPNIKYQSGEERRGSSAALIISQLLMFNCKRNSCLDSTRVRHEKDRETPVVQYLALLIHAQTRKKLIDKLHNLGLCISYDMTESCRYQQNLVTPCAFYEETNNVCPSKLRNGLFTTGCVDNIDHNPSSRTAKDSFHGTAITLTQHPEENKSGENRAITKIDPNIIKQKKLLELPKSYTEIRPVALKVNDFHAPKINGTLKPDDHLLPDAMATEYNWLGKVVSSFEHPEGSENSENVSWAAFHAATQPPITRPTTINALLPMFHEKTRTHAMILHVMEIVENAAPR